MDYATRLATHLQVHDHRLQGERAGCSHKVPQRRDLERENKLVGIFQDSVDGSPKGDAVYPEAEHLSPVVYMP